MNAAHSNACPRRSWVLSANEADGGFPLQNLPFCAFVSEDNSTHLGVGIGSQILDLHACVQAGLFASLSRKLELACTASCLNDLMQLGPNAAKLLRKLLTMLLQDDAEPHVIEQVTCCLLSMSGAQFCKPVRIGNYTDFYASIHHATNVGRLFRPDQPLLPNYKYLPIGYHGRASSAVVSDTPIARPNGQTRSVSQNAPRFGPSRELDYEVEIGAYIGVGNELGNPIAIDGAEHHIFGFTLVNDWSARDIQAWEYQPLGPFLGKSFATSISPWVVTSDALAPFRVPLALRPPEDPELLPYLRSSKPISDGPGSNGPGSNGINVQVEVSLTTTAMRAGALEPVRLSTANARDLYWSFSQIVAHHTSNGCNLLTGDLLASGTISGPDAGALGCLLEITQRGAKPLTLPNGETRTFLEDGDEIIMTGICRREGYPSISFGECRGKVLPTPR